MNPGYPFRIVSAPDTYWISVHATPASFRASPAAASPYSTKLRPHLPHGCMPAPRTATRLSSGIGGLLAAGSSANGLPLPYQVLVLVILVEGVEHQGHVGADLEVVDGHPGNDLAHHHHLLRTELDRRDAERHVGVGGHI